MRPLVIASNMLMEANNDLEGWIENMQQVTDLGILVVDGGSTDGTKEILEAAGVIVITDNIIQREGYGPARNQLRKLCKENFPEAHWMAYFDADERINEKDIHFLKWVQNYLNESVSDVVAFPRIDWFDKEKTKSNNDIRIVPDFQARMTRLNAPLEYIRICHEQIVTTKGIFCNIDVCPPIHHFHRSASKDKRDYIGKVCAMLHSKDPYGHTYPKHHKEDYYFDLYQKEGL